MENLIIKHIEVLIRRHDYVIVPDLGGFVFQKQSAVIFLEQITPPLAVVSFNPLMKISDGLLAIEIARSERISFRESMQLIESQVLIVKSMLAQGKSVDFGNLGLLKMDSDKKLIFEPSGNSRFIPVNFGLSPVHYSPRTQQTDQDDRREIRILLPTRAKIAKYVAVAMVAAGIFFASPQIGENYHNYSNFNPFSKITQTEEQSEVICTETEEVVVDDLAIQALEEEVQEVVVVPEVELKHHVIVSCMNTLKEAERYREWLKSQDYTEAHILEPIKTYRISIQSFETKEAAIAFMTELRNTKSQFSDAWVLSE